MCNPTFHARWKDTEFSIMNEPAVHVVMAHKNLGRFILCAKSVDQSLVKMWNMISEEYKLDHKWQIIQGWAYDPEFKLNKTDYRLKSWPSKGIKTFYSFSEKAQLNNLKNPRREYCLEKSDFPRCLQAHNHFEHNVRN